VVAAVGPLDVLVLSSRKPMAVKLLPIGTAENCDAAS
jgi:hypothetical protein